MKKIAIGLGLLLSGLIAAALIAPSFVNFNNYKSQIAEQVRSATGRNLVIDGDISLSLLPAPSLSVGRVRLGSLNGASVPDMIALKSLDVRVALLPLLRGEITIERIRVIDPVVVLEVLPDGRRNWRFSPDASVAARKGSGSEAADGQPAGVFPAMKFRDVAVENATVVYRDPTAGIDERLEGLDLTISADSLSGPIHMSGATVAHGLPVNFKVSVGSFAEGHVVPIGVELGLKNGSATVSFSGSATEPTANAKVSGTLRAKMKDFRRVAEAVLTATGRPGTTIISALAQPAELGAVVEGSRKDVSLNDINLKLGETLATGAISLAFAEKPSLDGTLKVNRIDLDALTANGASTRERGREVVQSGQKGAKKEANGQGSPAFAFPPDLTGSLNMEVGALIWRGAIVRQVRFDASLQGGELAVRRASALAPGGSDIAVSGVVKTGNEGPRFDGQLEAASDNFRAVLDWLKVDLRSVPTDRLRSMRLTSAVTLTPELVQVYGIDLRFDASRLSGGVAYAFRKRPSFSVDVTVDRLNADAYLPAAAQTSAKPAPRGGAADSAGTGKRDRLKSFSLAVLDSFDTNFKVMFGSLTIRKQALSKIRFDASLIGGVLTVREFSVAQAEGASFALAGSAGRFSADPTFALKGVARIGDPSAFARFAGLSLPGPAAALGIPDLSLDVQGTLAKANIDLDAKLAPAQLKLSGTFKPLLVTEGADLTIEVRAESMRRLASALGLGGTVGGVKDSPLVLTGGLKGGLEGAAVNLDLSVLGGDVTAKGRLAELGTEAVHDLELTVRHPNLNVLMRDLGTEFEPTARNLGPLSLKIHVAGDRTRTTATGLESDIGPVKLTGRGEVRFDGPRPKLTVELKANDILGDLFLPVPVTGPKGRIHTAADAGQGIPTPKERWSREPLDLSALKTFDADISLAAAGIDVRGYAFAEPQLSVRLENGVLDVTRLKGRLFDGTVDLTARLHADDVPSFQTEIKLAGADLAKALVQTAGVDAVSGRFGFSGTFHTSGRSQYEMIRALDGKGELRVRDGIIRGINLKAVSDALGSRGDVAELLSLVAKATARGETPFESLTGTITVQNGIVRSNDMVAKLEAAEGTAQGSVDLPQWMIDAVAEFRLTERSDAPPLGISLRGPLDNPRKDVKTAALKRFLAQRAATGILRKAIGKDRLRKILGEPKTQPQRQQPQTQARQPQASQAPVFGAPSQPPQPAQPAPQDQPSADPLQQLLDKGLKKLIK